MTRRDQTGDKLKKPKELVGETDRLHKAGNHADPVKTAQEALAN